MAHTRILRDRRRKWKGRPRKLTSVTDRQLEYLRAIADGDDALVPFLAYVYRLQTAPVGDGTPGRREVPVPHETVTKLCKKADWRRLTLRGIAPSSFGAQTEPVLDFREYSVDLERCRHFWLRADVVGALDERRALTAADAEATEYRSPKTGRRDREPATSSEWAGGHRLPPLVRGALRALEYGEFDPAGVERWLRDRREARDALPAGPDRDEAVRAVRSGEACYETVVRQLAGYDSGRGTARYHLAYHAASSGRIFQIGGGLQGAPGAMKAAAYLGVPGARNYDLRASQLAVFLELADEDGVATPAAGALLDGNFEGVAARCGVSRKAVKRAVYALLNGATLPTPVGARDGLRKCDAASGVVVAVVDDVVEGGLRRRIAREVDTRRIVVGVSPDRGVRFFSASPLSPDEEDRFLELYTALRGALEPVATEARAWHAVLGDEERHRDHPDERKRADYGRGVLHLPNRCRMGLNINPKGDDGERRFISTSKISAHLLQGVESAFVHALTARLAAREVRVLSNEHDGLVVVGEVIDSDVRAAREASGYRSADLVEKPFEDDDPTEDGTAEDPLAPDPGEIWR